MPIAWRARFKTRALASKTGSDVLPGGMAATVSSSSVSVAFSVSNLSGSKGRAPSWWDTGEPEHAAASRAFSEVCMAVADMVRTQVLDDRSAVHFSLRSCEEGKRGSLRGGSVCTDFDSD